MESNSGLYVQHCSILRGGEWSEVSSEKVSSPRDVSRSPAFRSSSYDPPAADAGSKIADRLQDVGYMRCSKPFVTRGGAFGCGQCLPCRITKRRTWAHRILLEAVDHGSDNSFVTLTYEKDRRSLEPIDLQRWLKRFRRAVEPRKIRYFAVGEYGDISLRPHYHVALFGWPACFGGNRNIKGGCLCPACSVVRETWSYGHVMVGRLEQKSASYIAGYVTKKMTHASDIRLDGRYPEFARMSLNPGIGANAMWNVASDIMKHGVEKDITALRYGRKIVPLGKYLTRKLRTYRGRSPDAPEEARQIAANQMQLLRAYAWENSRSVSSVFAELFGVSEVALEHNHKQRVTL